MKTPDESNELVVPEFPDDLVQKIEELFGEPHPSAHTYDELFPDDATFLSDQP